LRLAVTYYDVSVTSRLTKNI